jgi:hypothetical protein
MDTKKLLMGLLSWIVVTLFLFSATTLITVNAIDSTLLNDTFVIIFLNQQDVYNTSYNELLPNLAGGDVGVVDILREEITLEEFTEFTNDSITKIITYLKVPNTPIPVLQLPDTDLLNFVGGGELHLETLDVDGLLPQIKSYVQFGLQMKVVLLFSSVLFFVLMLLLPKTLPKKIKRGGHALFLVGISGVISWFSFNHIVPAVVSRSLSASLGNTALQDFFLGVILDLFRAVGQKILDQSVLVLAAGIALLVGGFLFDKHFKKKDKLDEIEESTHITEKSE